MTQIDIIATGLGEGSGNVPIADGAGGFSWGPATGASSISGWVTNTAYTQGQQVSYQGQLYYAQSSFTSGASFAADGAKWGQTSPLGEIVGSVEWLISQTIGQTFALNSATRNANEVITSASVIWPDGSTGTFTATTINATFNTIDAFTVTYVPSVGGSHTVTQAAVTRDAAGGVTAQPTPTVV